MYRITYNRKGIPHDFKRIDTIETFTANSYFKPNGVSLIYFKVDRFNYVTVAEEDIISIDEI